MSSRGTWKWRSLTDFLPASLAEWLRRSPRERQTPRLIPAFSVGFVVVVVVVGWLVGCLFVSLFVCLFPPRVESYQWLKIWDLMVATLSGARRYRVSARTGWPSISLLWLGKVERLICNFYISVTARTIVWADPSLRYTSMLLGR